MRVEGFSKISATVLPGERLGCTPPRLACDREVEHVAQGRRLEVHQFQEVPGRLASRPRLWLPSALRSLRSAHCAAAYSRRASRGGRRGRAGAAPRPTSASVMISGGARRSTFFPAATVSSPSATPAACMSVLETSGRSLRPSSSPAPCTSSSTDGMPLREPRAARARDGAPRGPRRRGSPAPASRPAPHCRRRRPAGCRRRWCHACRASGTPPRAPWRRTAPSGKPPPMPLAEDITSGSMPAH